LMVVLLEFLWVIKSVTREVYNFSAVLDLESDCWNRVVAVKKLELCSSDVNFSADSDWSKNKQISELIDRNA